MYEDKVVKIAYENPGNCRAFSRCKSDLDSADKWTFLISVHFMICTHFLLGTFVYPRVVWCAAVPDAYAIAPRSLRLSHI